MAFGIPGINTVVPPSYKLFISHAWDHAQYDALVELIKPDMRFRWENLSVPKENPIAMLVGLPKSARTLVREIDERIRDAHCVVIITGMFVAHSQWIQSEIEAALDFKKPIVGVAPRGQERIPEAAKMAIENARTRPMEPGVDQISHPQTGGPGAAVGITQAAHTRASGVASVIPGELGAEPVYGTTGTREPCRLLW